MVAVGMVITMMMMMMVIAIMQPWVSNGADRRCYGNDGKNE